MSTLLLCLPPNQFVFLHWESRNLKEFSKCGLIQNSLDTVNASQSVSFWKAVLSARGFGAGPSVFSHTPCCSGKMSTSSILCLSDYCSFLLLPFLLKEFQTAFLESFQIQFCHQEQWFTFKQFPQSHLRAQSPKPSPPKPLYLI